LGMRTLDEFLVCKLFFSNRNPKSEITLAPFLQQIPASRKDPKNFL
jgi:hypothetical protein